MQPDGRILVAGHFWHVGPLLRWGIARVLPDGNPDVGFQPPIKGCPGCFVFFFVLQDDGKIVVAGRFQSEDERWRGSIARLNSDGNLDPDFAVSKAALPRLFRLNDSLLVVDDVEPGARCRLQLGPRGQTSSHILEKAAIETTVRVVLPLRDGKFLAVGDGAWRVFPNGSIDPTFRGSDVWGVMSAKLQGDKILVLNGQGQLNRINANGTPDASFKVALLKVHG